MHRALEDLTLIAGSVENLEDFKEFLEIDAEENEIETLDDLTAVLEEHIM